MNKYIQKSIESSMSKLGPTPSREPILIRRWDIRMSIWIVSKITNTRKWELKSYLNLKKLIRPRLYALNRLMMNLREHALYRKRRMARSPHSYLLRRKCNFKAKGLERTPSPFHLALLKVHHSKKTPQEPHHEVELRISISPYPG